MARIEACVVTHTGNVRVNNEDNFYLNGIYMNESESDCSQSSFLKEGSEHIFAVCDGMGGQAAGEKASLAAVKLLKKIHQWIEENDKKKDMEVLLKWLNRYVLRTNEYIFNMSQESGSRMGTTFACVLVWEKKAVALNLGDSRVYFIRNGELRQISADHTEAERLIRLGVLSRESAKHHKSKHLLSRHFGISPEEGIIEAEISDIIDLEQGDMFLLCSDGLTDMLDDSEIRGIVVKKVELRSVCNELVKEALKNGGVDNITSLLINVESLENN